MSGKYLVGAGNLLAAFLVSAVGVMGAESNNADPKPAPPVATKSVKELQADFLKLKFGMFIHYNMATYTGEQWVTGYPDPSTFNPGGPVDTDAWADAAKSAGMQYAIFTAKHVAGFCLWDSKYTTYDVMNPKCPYQQDLVAQFIKSFKSRGIKVGLYYHWRHPGFGDPNKHKVLAPECDPATHSAEEQKQFQMKQIAELLEKYPDCFYFWNDAYDPKIGTAEELLTMERGIRPNLLASSNWWDWGKKGTPFLDIAVKELGHFPEGNQAPGETCFSMAGQKWFWDSSIRGYGSAQDVLGKLQTANARNSNLLLNVPPNKQGKFDDAAVKVLAEVGMLLKKDAAEQSRPQPDGKPAEIKKPVSNAAVNLLHETNYYGVQLAEDQPEFAGFWLDSIGKGRKWHNAMLGGNLKQSYRKESSDGWVNYHPVGQADALTGFKFDASSILIRSEARANEAVEPFVMKFNLKGRYPAFATLLGRMEKDGEVNLPAVLHIPGQGTVRITARSAQAMPLRLKYESEKKLVSEEMGNSQFVKITFPAASEACAWIEYRLDVVNIYPKTTELENDERFDGYRRCWLNIMQLSPSRRMLANNAVSDVCGLCYHEYGEIAALTGELADGVTGQTLLRDSLNRFLDDGQLGYGMAKYKGEPHYPEASLDTWPSLLIAAHQYYQASGDQQWLERQIGKLTKWGEESLATDKDGNGLLEYHQSGNAGDCHFRPANWWDAINFGHEDAYSNALAYRAFRGLALMEKKAGKDDQAERFEKAAQKLKAAYYKTFFNPETGMLAGWKSRDGKLHDYGFTFIQGLAIAYGLIDDAATANKLLDATLKKIKDVGFNRFDLGLPGNLVAIPPEDYFQKFMKPSWDKQRHPFQTYENGGTSANHTYYLISALYQHGRIKDGDMILLPILKSFNEGGFSGYEGPWVSYDWMSWDGKPHGYEGLLVDNYLAVKAVLVRQGLVDPEWGCLRKSQHKD